MKKTFERIIVAMTTILFSNVAFAYPINGNLDLAGNLNMGSSGVRISQDGDGAITFKSLGNGFLEDLTLNLDDTSNTGVFSSSTGLNVLNFSGITLQESGNAVLNAGNIDTSAELSAIVGDETGSGALVFGTSPTIASPSITGTVTGSASYSTPTITSPSITGTVGGGASYTGPTITNPSITGTVSGGASYTAPTITSPSITGTVGGSATYTTPTLSTPVIANFTSATHDHTNAAGGGQLSITGATTGTLSVARGGTGTTTATGSAGSVVLSNSPTIVTPTIASFTNATHDHLTAAGGGNLSGNAITSNITGTGNVVKNNGPTLAGVVTVGGGSATAVNPNVDNTFDLGGSASRFANIYTLGFIGTGSGTNRISFANGGQVQVANADLKLTTGDLIIPSGSEFFLDGGSDTSIRESSANIMQLRAGGTDRITIDSTTGYVKITAQLVPASDNVRTLGESGARWTAVWAVNPSIQTSDKREKKDIQDSDLGLEFIDALRPVSYRWKQKDNGTHYGFIAQEVEKTLNGKDFWGVLKPKSKKEMYGMSYQELIAPMVKAIQELSDKVERLESSKKKNGTD